MTRFGIQRLVAALRGLCTAILISALAPITAHAQGRPLLT